MYGRSKSCLHLLVAESVKSLLDFVVFCYEGVQLLRGGVTLP